MKTVLVKFSNEVCKAMKYYVYRLVDPRDGSTFYVGKGKNNRVFDHVKQVLKFRKPKSDADCQEDEKSAKYQQIEEIHNAGLEVISVIHRHGIENKDVAYQIEGALIDAYQGLTNIQGGHGNLDYGCVNAKEIEDRYAAQEIALEQGKFVIIKIRKDVIDARGSVYEAVRRAWRIDVNKISGRDVIACVQGVIRGVFVIANGRSQKRKWEGGISLAKKQTKKSGKDLWISGFQSGIVREERRHQ